MVIRRFFASLNSHNPPYTVGEVTGKLRYIRAIENYEPGEADSASDDEGDNHKE